MPRAVRLRAGPALHRRCVVQAAVIEGHVRPGAARGDGAPAKAASGCGARRPCSTVIAETANINHSCSLDTATSTRSAPKEVDPHNELQLQGQW
jgi:hypothetical protein